jgi:hypothetical protein
VTIGTTQQEMIAPHGGELIDRLAPEEDREGLLREADRLAKVTLGPGRSLTSR